MLQLQFDHPPYHLSLRLAQERVVQVLMVEVAPLFLAELFGQHFDFVGHYEDLLEADVLDGDWFEEVDFAVLVPYL